MFILFHTTFSDKKNWIKQIKKHFKNSKIVSIKDTKLLDKVEYAIVWNLPNMILKQLTSLKIIFSQGAGVDHILNLSNYKNTPIIRLKDPIMGERMANHVLSQVLNYQLYLSIYAESQKKNIWIDNLELYTPLENKKLTIGILGTGFLGTYVGNFLKNLNYNVIGFKKNKSKKNLHFPIYYPKKIKKFINLCDVIIAILPSTKETINFIDKNFLLKMKKKSLLVNVGRGITLNEKDLIKHLRANKNFYVSLDVFNEEPLPKKNKLWSQPNVTITPHVASITVVESAVKQMYQKYKYYKKNGKIISDVNLKSGY